MKRDILITSACIFLFVLAFVWALSAGSLFISWETLWKAFIGADSDVDESIRYIIFDIRLARTVLAAVVGAALALSGVVYQGVLLNPLADPYTLGVSTGAAFGASVAILFGVGSVGWSGHLTIPVAAFLGALLALCFVYLLGQIDGQFHPANLILAGIIVSTFLSALISLLKSLHEESISAIVFWIMGSLSGKTWEQVLIILPYFLLGTVVMFYYSTELDLLALGDVQAMHLGVSVARVRFVLLSVASLMTAASVSFTGIIGFVGLVVPHVVRLMVGPKHFRLLFYSIFAGGILMLVADTVSRTILGEGQEIPVGVVTALIGGPFFCLILVRRRKEMGMSS
ncbi:FecCD family ABC transporter permease [Thermodesulforhabdus norvegica]|uniref:Iron complex transport system permease protein n=1 Tax=Thermodesulforhabdus norvegica TaxID=39841 RepID=A0A1I4R169_9BACT|nr:iron ABC transporter permease [Thermodesulforhabdus norvegica]SFM45845.1 iron complex transport system permease protein [Thermodesulforhabdus norvegica]